MVGLPSSSERDDLVEDGAAFLSAQLKRHTRGREQRLQDRERVAAPPRHRARLGRDQGEGVFPDERERIFEPFHRSPAARKDARGAGLGLAIARELARRYGGDVALGEERSCFVVTLPPGRQQVEASAAAETPSRPLSLDEGGEVLER
jgi:nitrogen-specific signal transduction histidine kinase